MKKANVLARIILIAILTACSNQKMTDTSTETVQTSIDSTSDLKEILGKENITAIFTLE